MGCGTTLPDEHQLVLGPIERAHAGIVLVPDAEVLELAIDGLAGLEHLGHVPPVHADLMDRAVDAVGHQRPEDRRQEGRKLHPAHLTAAHREAAVTDAAEAADVTVNGYVVGRIGKDQLGLGVAE